ncbi:MAG TPA: antibiotic biosynthesis monooxygenase, partial [Rubrobacter sp.]|nr:antibiotic biosynthesis monooxygenase [Rubrobacter sp.]
TVAHWKLKPGKREELVALLHRQLHEEERFISGLIVSLLYILDSDPDQGIIMAVFDSAESYRANAATPEQHRRYLEIRDLLAEEPEWNDGEIETYVLAEGANFSMATYGTVAHVQIRPGARHELEELTRRQLAEDAAIPGQIGSYVLEIEGKPDEAYLIVAFQSREQYVANTQDPHQHQRYLEMRALLESDPTWYDGSIVPYARF